VSPKKFLAPMLTAAALATSANAAPPIENFQAPLTGFNELGVVGDLTGAIFTAGHGHVDVVLDRVNMVVHYSLNLGNGTVDTPACPASGTVTGTIALADLLAQPSEGIPANDFQVVEDALETNTAYVNVHSKTFPTGEIRGQLEP
jgi:hypothetical protein